MIFDNLFRFTFLKFKIFNIFCRSLVSNCKQNIISLTDYLLNDIALQCNDGKYLYVHEYYLIAY